MAHSDDLFGGFQLSVFDFGVMPTPAYEAKRATLHAFAPGDHVTTSGFAGVIVREYSCRMYEVRLASGLVCVDMSDIVRV